MNLLSVTATAALALAAAACSSGASNRAVTKLDCPATQDKLQRVSQAADGKSCGYVSDDGAEITLQLIPVSGSVDATLEAMETQLSGELAQPPTEPPASDASLPAGGAPASASATAEARAVRAQAAADANAKPNRRTSPSDNASGDADWNVDADHDRAKVDFPGVHIDAADEHATVRIGPLHINAGEDGAVIRMQRDVRLKGESLSRKKRGVRATYLITSGDHPGGYSYAGYEAGGPRTGPLTVALVKGRERGDHEDIYDAVKRLVRRNGGV